MKRGLFFLFITLYFSCTKPEMKIADQVASASTEVTEMDGHRNSCGCKNVAGATIFDPNCLVSPASHCKLDTIQKGFGFTEGPAVDRWGNVYFTDQPNDKIYRWDVFTGKITL